MHELLRLVEQERRARGRVDEVGRAARDAQAELTAARKALVELEREAAATGKPGFTVSATSRSRPNP
jgi:hypothetical protein